MFLQQLRSHAHQFCGRARLDDHRVPCSALLEPREWKKTSWKSRPVSPRAWHWIQLCWYSERHLSSRSLFLSWRQGKLTSLGWGYVTMKLRQTWRGRKQYEGETWRCVQGDSHLLCLKKERRGGIKPVLSISARTQRLPSSPWLLRAKSYCLCPHPKDQFDGSH